MSIAAPPPSPLDRALTHLLESAPDAALAELLPWLEARGEPGAVLAAGQALALAAQDGRPVAESAERVLRAAARIATRARSFGCAAAACGELERRGADSTGEYEALGAAFSGRPEPTRATPPSLTEGDCRPAHIDWLELVDRVETICEQLAEGPVSAVAPGATEHLCSKLEPADLVAFARALSFRIVPAGELIIEEGNPGRAAYFLARGELEVFRGSHAKESGVQASDRMTLARLGAGSLFGEMALLSRSPRAASVVALRPSLVLRGSKRALDEATAKTPRLGRALASFCRRRMIDNLVRTSVVLRPLPTAQRTALLERFQAHTFERGQVVIAQGQERAGLHLVASGALRVVAEEQGESTHLATLGTGDVVGEVGLVLRRPASAAVVADCPSVTLHLPAQDFHALIKEHPALLAQLYDLAVQREDETRSLLAQQAQDASDWVLF